MGPKPESTPDPGTVVAGKYRVERVIASGGMGVIVEAEHATLGQRVAIKFLLPEAGAQAELVERFLREARAAARLSSDHVVRVFDIGTDERRVPFMVMELLSGRDLAREIEVRGPLPVGEAVGYVVEALDAIVEAHAAGIVHRDLKPSNLFLAERPDGARRIKVLDFGISKLAPHAAPDAALTSTKSMLGSPGYMSPEQVRSTKTVDVRTDVWALGVILYELLTGAPAFTGETLGDVFAKIREEDLPPIRDRRTDAPEGLEAVLSQCLQRNRDKRIPDAATLRSLLAPFTAGGHTTPALGSTKPAIRNEMASAATMAAPAASAAGELQRPVSETLATWTGDRGGRRRSRIVAGSALAVAAAAAAVWLAFLRPPPATGAHDRASAAVTTAEPPRPVPPVPADIGAAAPPVVTPSEPPAPSATTNATASATASAAPPHAHSAGRTVQHVLPPPPVTVTPAPTKKKKEDLGI